MTKDIDNSFGIEGIYIIAPEGVDENWTLPGTCLKAGYFGLSETHHLNDLSIEDKVLLIKNINILFENEIKNKEYENEIKRIIENNRKLKNSEKTEGGLNFSDLCKIKTINNIKVTTIIGENGSGKTQILKEINKINENNGFSSYKEFKIKNNIKIKITDFGRKLIYIHKSKLINKNNIIFDSHELNENSILSMIDSNKNQKGIIGIFKLIFGINNIYESSWKFSLVFGKPESFLKEGISEGIYGKGMRTVIPSLIILGYYLGIKIKKEENIYFDIYELLDKIDPYIINKISTEKLEMELFGYIKVIENIFFHDEKKIPGGLLSKTSGGIGGGVGGNSELINIVNSFCKIIEKKISSQKGKKIIYKGDKIKKQISKNYPTYSRTRSLKAFFELVKDSELYRKNNYKSGILIGQIESNEILGKGIILEFENLCQPGVGLHSKGDIYSKYYNIYKPGNDLLGFYREDYQYARNEYRVDMISSGEKSILIRFLSNISKNIKEGEENIILIDEPDVFLHIRRQKAYIKILIERLSNTFNNTKFHIIIATHSPFIVSDIPENNLLILEKGKDATNEHIDYSDKKNSFANTAYGIVSQFMGIGKDQGTLGDFTKSILSDFVVKYKRLLNELWALDEKFDNGEEIYDNRAEKRNEINILYEEHKYVIDGIGDEFLKKNILYLINK